MIKIKSRGKPAFLTRALFSEKPMPTLKGIQAEP